MPIFVTLFLGAVIAVIAVTGAALDKKKVRRSWRVAVWVSLFLLIPFSFFVLFLVEAGLNWHSC